MNNIKINEKLVRQVQDREACIEHTGLKSDLPQLRTVMKLIAPSDELIPYGFNRFYYLDGDEWNWKETPSGMEAIPIKDFFVEEVEEDTALHDYFNKSWEPVDKVEGEGLTPREVDLWEQVFSILIPKTGGHSFNYPSVIEELRSQGYSISFNHPPKQ